MSNNAAAPATKSERNHADAFQSGSILDFSIFTLTDKAEQDDNCAGIYHKSLLYLVSNAFEQRFRIPVLRPDGGTNPRDGEIYPQRQSALQFDNQQGRLGAGAQY